MGSQDAWATLLRLTGYQGLLSYARGHDLAYDVSKSLQQSSLFKEDSAVYK